MTLTAPSSPAMGIFQYSFQRLPEENQNASASAAQDSRVTVHEGEKKIVSSEQSAGLTKLGKYIVRRLTDHEELQDSTQRKCVRRGLEVTAIGIVAGARIGMTMICLTGSAEILNEKITDPGALSMGIINATGAIISFGFLSAFTKMKIIDILTRYIPDSEQEIISEDLSPCARTIIKTVSVVLGFSSQIPMGIGAYNSALFAPAVMGIFTFLDGGRSSWSVYNTISSAIQLRIEPKEGIKADLIKMRKLLVKKIETFRTLLAETHNKVNTDGASLLKNIDLTGLEDKQLNAFIEKILLNKIEPNQVPSLSTGVSWMVDGLVAIMAASVLAEFYKLGEDGMSGLTDNSTYKALFATFVTLANVNLWYSLVSKTTHAALNILRGISPASLTKKIAPTFYDRFTKWGTWISVPTFVPSVYFAKLYFPSWAFYPTAALSSAAAFLGGLSALHGLRDIIIRRRNSANEEIQLDGKLEKISATMAKANLREIALFLASLPNDSRIELNAPSLERLKAFIAEEKS